MTITRIGGGIAALGMAAVALLAAPPAHGADAKSDTTRAVSYVRAAHLSPDTPRVDVYLTSFSGGTTRLWLEGVGYGDVSPYRRLPSGQYALSMRPHGAPASSAVALRWTVRLGSGDAYTAAAIGQHTDLHGIVIDDTLAAPRAGTGYVRVVQAARAAGSVAVSAGRTPITTGTGYGTATPYVPVRSGTVLVSGRSLTSSRDVGQVRLAIPSRSINTVVVLDRQGGGIALRQLTDAAGAQTAPSGAVPAGGGGTADPSTRASAGDEAALVALLVVICAGGGALTLRMRRDGR